MPCSKLRSLFLSVGHKKNLEKATQVFKIVIKPSSLFIGAPEPSLSLRSLSLSRRRLPVLFLFLRSPCTGRIAQTICAPPFLAESTLHDLSSARLEHR